MMATLSLQLLEVLLSRRVQRTNRHKSTRNIAAAYAHVGVT